MGGQQLYKRLSDLPFEDLTNPQVQQRFHEDHPRWQHQTERFARLAEGHGYPGHRFGLATIDFAALGVAADDLVEEVVLRFPNGALGEAAPSLELSLLLGAYRFTPAAEQQRYEQDEAARTGTVDELKAYLKGESVPLLEPDSAYRIVAEWDAVTGGVTDTATSKFNFRTASLPPNSADAYLLATFPQDRETVHFASEPPGFCLGSADALRILAKFPDSRLRITINEDNGAPVLDSTDALRWIAVSATTRRTSFPTMSRRTRPPGSSSKA